MSQYRSVGHMCSDLASTLQSVVLQKQEVEKELSNTQREMADQAASSAVVKAVGELGA
jgi:chaperonin cofactor prefoldin